jgi:hypothetical protein
VRPIVLSRIAATAVAAVATVTASIAASASAAAPPSFPTLGPARPASQIGLSGVWCASATNCLAVGVSGANPGNSATGDPLAEIWNGKRWRTVPVRLPAGSTFGALSHLACLSATWCVAVGVYGKGSTAHELAEFWNGKAWAPGEPPAPAGSADDTVLLGVSCVSAKYCMAVGTYDASGNSLAVTDKWNGAKWARVNPQQPPGSDVSILESVSCTSATFCLATGASRLGVLAESWNGTSWRRLKAPDPAGSFAELTSVSCSSPDSCVGVGAFAAVGGGAASLTETWNGKSWTIATVPWPKGTGNSQLIGVSCVSKTHCVAVGNLGMNLKSDLNAGRAAAAVWNGKAWTVQPVPAPANGKSTFFHDVSCRSATSCVTVGYTGPVHSADSTSLSGFWNGKAWKLIAAPSSSSVAFVQADDTGTINGNTTSIPSGQSNQVLAHDTGIGHTVVLVIQTLSATQTDTVTSITSGMGTFHFVNSYNDGADNEIWVCTDTTGAADTITVNTPTNAWDALAVEFNQPATGVINGGGQVTNPGYLDDQSWTVSPGAAGNVALVAVDTADAYVTAPAAPWTYYNAGYWSFFNGTSAAWQVAPSSSPLTATWETDGGLSVAQAVVLEY